MILDQINKRWLSWLNANLRRRIDENNKKYGAARKKYEDATRKSEAAEQENADLRRRIAELEQQRNGGGNGAK